MFKVGSIKKGKNPYHPDVLIWLIGIPFISGFNYYLTYSSVSINLFFALTYSIDTIQGYIAVLVVRWHILYLDEVYPYEKSISKRILLQTISGSILGLIVISLLTESVSLIARGKFVPIEFYSFDLFIISIWFFFVNGVYVMLQFINKWKSIQQVLKSDDNDLIVKVGLKNIRLSFDDIAVITTDGDYSRIQSIGNKNYYYDKSLNALQKLLPSTNFYRLNRQYIANRKSVYSFKSIENGKLEVEILNQPDVVVVSRDKASEFRGWMNSANTFRG